MAASTHTLRAGTNAIPRDASRNHLERHGHPAHFEPRRYIQGLLLATVLGATFRNYWTYSHYEHLDPSVWMSFIEGTGAAPEQYRVGVKLVAWWIMQHVGGGFRHSFALLDAVFSSAAALVLYGLLQRSRAYRASQSPVYRWLGSAVFVGLFFYYLSWLPWFEKAETLPSAGLITGLLWFWSPRSSGNEHGSGAVRPMALTVAVLLLLTIAQALVRADLACLLNVGMFLAACTPGLGQGLALPRRWALGVKRRGCGSRTGHTALHDACGVPAGDLSRHPRVHAAARSAAAPGRRAVCALPPSVRLDGA